MVRACFSVSLDRDPASEIAQRSDAFRAVLLYQFRAFLEGTPGHAAYEGTENERLEESAAAERGRKSKARFACQRTHLAITIEASASNEKKAPKPRAPGAPAPPDLPRGKSEAAAALAAGAAATAPVTAVVCKSGETCSLETLRRRRFTVLTQFFSPPRPQSRRVRRTAAHSAMRARARALPGILPR